jgi:hypothetical protein
MRPRGFIDNWRPQLKSLALLEKVDAIVAAYAMALTIRQIFYRLVARYFYEKTEQAYDNLAELLNMATPNAYSRGNEVKLSAEQAGVPDLAKMIEELPFRNGSELIECLRLYLLSDAISHDFWVSKT